MEITPKQKDIEPNFLETENGLSFDETPQMNTPAVPNPDSNIVPSPNGSVLARGTFQSPNFIKGIAGWKLGAEGNIEGNDGVFRGKVKIGGLIINLKVGDNIQTAIDEVNTAGGGKVILANGTHTLTANLTLYTGISLEGQNSVSTTINCNSGAYKITADGTGVYTTGTITGITSGVNVTGSGTSWLANVTAGQHLFLGTRWYKIAAVTGDTTLVLAEGYTDNVTLPASYRIASVIEGIALKEFMIKSSTTTAITITDARKIVLDNVQLVSNNKGIVLTNVSECNTDRTLVVTSTSNGIELTNVSLCDWESVNVISNGGSGFVLNNVKTSSFLPCSSTANTTDGFNITTGVDLVMIPEASGNGGQGIELVSGCSGIHFLAGPVKDNTSDGIKLTATTDNIKIIGLEINDNGGYGINVAASTCDDAIISSNHFSGNTSGAVNDSGTGTVIRGNVGVDDNSQTTPAGVITPYGAASAPSGWLLCDGAAVSRTTYATLFGIISTTYGVGDGSTTFNTPNLKGRVPVGFDSGQTEFDALAETGGAKTHTLTTNEMPAHTHGVTRGSGDGTNNNITDNDGGTQRSTTSTSTGGGSAHSNLQPYITLNYIIKT